MRYRAKLIALSTLVGLLALVYAGSFVVEALSAAAKARSRLLDARAVPAVSRLTISFAAERTTLEKRGDRWFALRGDAAYPVKAARVDDLLAALSAESLYERRASTAAAHGALGLTEDAAARLIVSGASGAVFLDLLVGDTDASGREINLRFAGADESFSGIDRFSSVLKEGVRAWLDLSLFAHDPVRPESIQRISVRGRLGTEGKRPGRSVGYAALRDAGRGWILEGRGEALDPTKVDAYVKAIVSAEGEDFAEPGMGAVAPAAVIVLETGDGRERTVEIASAGPDGRSPATVSGSPYRYLLGAWNVERLVRDASQLLSDERK